MSAVFSVNHVELFLIALWLVTLVAGGIVEYRKAALESRDRKSLGRLAALIIFLSGIAVLGLEILSSRQTIADTNRTVAEIQRVLGRFESVEASFKLRVPAGHSAVADYRAWLLQQNGCFLPNRQLIIASLRFSGAWSSGPFLGVFQGVSPN
jgi:hypothetical protein